MAKVFLVAAEASGDALASEIVNALRGLRDDIEFAGIGAGALKAVGVESPFDISPLSVVGLVEGLKAYGDVTRLADEAVEYIQAFNPDVVLLVDSWGFTLRVAQRLRKISPDLRLIKVIGPQVWATRPRRARTQAETFDHVMCIHGFELPFYAPFEIKTTVIGNPALGRDIAGNGLAYRAKRRLDPDALVIGVLPGSRASELERVAPVLMDAARMINEDTGLQAIVVPGEGMAEALGELPSWAHLEADPAHRFDAIAACDYVLACSGTVATEVAVLEKPMLVAYRLGWVTWAIARAFLFKSKFINLLNIAASELVIPEFVQTRCRAHLIAAEARRMLEDQGARTEQINAQNAALQAMSHGEGTPAERVAAGVLEDLGLTQ